MRVIANRVPVTALGVAAPAARPRPDRRSLDPAALFAAHHTAVFRAAYRITGQVQDAEDVLQNVFVQLLRLAADTEIANPPAYLSRLAVNASLNLVRQRRRRPTLALAPDGSLADPATGAPLEGVAPGDLSPAAALADPAAQELREGLRAALAQLPPRAAEVFALRYFEDYSNRQIATLLETSESSVGVTLYRARERLRRELAPLVPF